MFIFIIFDNEEDVVFGKPRAFLNLKICLVNPKRKKYFLQGINPESSFAPLLLLLFQIAGMKF